MTMTTSTPRTNPVTDPARPGAATASARRRELLEIHRQAGPLVAELSTGPAWAVSEQITVRLITEAATIANSHQPAESGSVPAVVRCRELATAQRRMVVALDADDGFDVGDAALVRARALLAELTDVAVGQRETLRR